MAAQKSGLGVDASGGPVIDPTKNVEDVVRAAVQRLDDLRSAEKELHDAKLAHVKEIGDLRASHQEKMDALVAAHGASTLAAEANRLNSIRQVDTATGMAQAAALATQIQLLAATNTQTAETLRNTVSTTAAAQETKTQQKDTVFSERLTTLEQGSYQERGKSNVTDPILSALAAKLDALTEARSASAGKSAGLSQGWALLLGALGAALAIYAALRR